MIIKLCFYISAALTPPSMASLKFGMQDHKGKAKLAQDPQQVQEAPNGTKRRKVLTPVEVVQNPNLASPNNTTPAQLPPNPNFNAQLDIAEFNDILKSLDALFPQPARFDPDFIFSDSPRVSITDLADTRKRLSLLLPLNFRLLVDSIKVAELADLSTMLLKTDPTLNPYQVSMLKLIQQLPSTHKTATEVKQLAEDIEVFLGLLQSNMTRASLLRGQYKESLRIVAKLRAEVDANVEAVRKLDHEQMPKHVTRRRSKLVSIGNMKMKELGDMRSYHNQLADNFARVSREIRAAVSEKRVFEARKILLKDQCVEILDKFSSLKRFTI